MKREVSVRMTTCLIPTQRALYYVHCSCSHLCLSCNTLVCTALLTYNPTRRLSEGVHALIRRVQFTALDACANLYRVCVGAISACDAHTSVPCPWDILVSEDFVLSRQLHFRENSSCSPHAAPHGLLLRGPLYPGHFNARYTTHTTETRRCASTAI